MTHAAKDCQKSAVCLHLYAFRRTRNRRIETYLQHNISTSHSTTMAARHSPSAGPSRQASSAEKTPPSSEELYRCNTCHSYHYIERCIYQLGWEAWLNYHQEYMSSQPVPEYVRFVNRKEPINLRKHARELDDKGASHRPALLPKTTLKADLMTQSSKHVLLEEQRRLAGRARPESLSPLARQTKGFRLAVDEGSGDELA